MLEIRGEPITQLLIDWEALGTVCEQMPDINFVGLCTLGIDVTFRRRGITLTEEELEEAAQVIALSWTAREVEEGVLIQAPSLN